MVGPALEFVARDILENDFELDSSGKIAVRNSCKGLAKLIVNPRITGTYANYWFMMCCPYIPLMPERQMGLGVPASGSELR